MFNKNSNNNNTLSTTWKVIVKIRTVVHLLLTTQFKINKFINSKASRAQKVTSVRIRKIALPTSSSSIIIQIILALITVRSGATVGAITLLGVSLLLVLGWSADVFRYLVALVYLGGVLVMLLYFTRFVTLIFKVRFILVIAVLVAGSFVTWDTVEEGISLPEIYCGPIELVLVALAYVLWLLSWIRQRMAAARI